MREDEDIYFDRRSAEKEPKYCPYCQRVLTPEFGIHIHDNVPHPDDYDIDDYITAH